MPEVRINPNNNDEQNKVDVFTEYTLKSKKIPSKSPKAMNSRIKGVKKEGDSKSKE